MTVGEICSREVVIVHRDEDLTTAARLMRQYHVGDVVVVGERDGARIPVGMLTDRDIVIKVLARQLNPYHLSVADVMSAGVETANEKEEILPTAARMRRLGLRRLPVVDDTGGLVGIITVDDLIDLLAEELRDLAAIVGRGRQRETRHG